MRGNRYARLTVNPGQTTAFFCSPGAFRAGPTGEDAIRLSIRTTSLLLLGLTALAVAAPSFAGDTRFEHRHPRRDQVMDRVQTQNRRITREVREGELTHTQAHALRAEDHSIAQQQRADARANGADSKNHFRYITRQQQKQLDQELSANSKQIGH